MEALYVVVLSPSEGAGSGLGAGAGGPVPWRPVRGLRLRGVGETVGERGQLLAVTAGDTRGKETSEQREEDKILR
ncbi:hypothetical protein WMY93_033906, partial [Mugilogobius chulae]